MKRLGLLKWVQQTPSPKQRKRTDLELLPGGLGQVGQFRAPAWPKPSTGCARQPQGITLMCGDRRLQAGTGISNE